MRVDCDVHIGYESISALAPYLPPGSRELLTHSATHGFTVPGYPWQHPTGWVRKDTYRQVGSAKSLTPGFTLEQLHEQLLDRYAIDRAIVIPDEPAGYSILPNTAFAADLCTAYNDWLAEHWLIREPKLAATVVVPAQHPQAAAAEIRRLAGRPEFAGVFLPGGARVPFRQPDLRPDLAGRRRDRHASRHPRALRRGRYCRGVDGARATRTSTWNTTRWWARACSGISLRSSAMASSSASRARV